MPKFEPNRGWLYNALWYEGPFGARYTRSWFFTAPLFGLILLICYGIGYDIATHDDRHELRCALIAHETKTPTVYVDRIGCLVQLDDGRYVPEEWVHADLDGELR